MSTLPPGCALPCLGMCWDSYEKCKLPEEWPFCGFLLEQARRWKARRCPGPLFGASLSGCQVDYRSLSPMSASTGGAPKLSGGSLVVQRSPPGLRKLLLELLMSSRVEEMDCFQNEPLPHSPGGATDLPVRHSPEGGRAWWLPGARPGKPLTSRLWAQQNTDSRDGVWALTDSWLPCICTAAVHTWARPSGESR